MRTVGIFGVGFTAIAAAAGTFVQSLVNAAALARFGFNVQGPSDYSPTLIYTNAAKSLRNLWALGQSSGAVRPTQYVSIVAGRPQANFQAVVVTGLADAGAGATGAGVYNIRFKGQATVGKATSATTPSAFTYNAGDGYSYGTWDLTSGNMIISFSDLSGDFDIETLEIIRPGYSFGGPKYTTEWGKLLNRAAFLRFMDWQGTNGSGVITLPSLARSNVAVTWGDMIDLCNDFDKDGWFCIPVLMPDSEITTFVTALRDQLEPGRKIYLEFGNELWNVAGGFSLQHTYADLTYRAGIYQHMEPLKWGSMPGNPYETSPATSTNTLGGDWRIRRVSNEVFIKHSGLPVFRTGQRFYISGQGGGAALSVMPSVGSYVTITVVSSTEFKFTNAGADVAEAVLSSSERPQAEHAPYLSISKTAGVVRIVHDGSLTIGASVGVVGFGTYNFLQENQADGSFKRYTPNVIDANTFEVTLTTAGADMAAVTNPVSSKTNHVMVMSDVANTMAQSMSAAAMSVYTLQARYIVMRTKAIKDIAKTVFGVNYASRVTTILAGQRGALTTNGALYSACDWYASTINGTPLLWTDLCDMLSTGDYPQWVAGDYPAIRADATGEAGAQLLVDKIPTREDPIRGLVSTAKVFGLKTGMYETGFDTAVPSSVSESVGVPIRFRELAHHSPIMRGGSKLMIDTIQKYGVDIQCWYGGMVAFPKTGAGTSSVGDSWFIAELMSSVGDVGSAVAANAPKLAGVDDYLTSALVPQTGNFYKGGPFVPYSIHVGAYRLPGVYGPTGGAGSYINLTVSGMRGGLVIQPMKGAGTTYPWPILRFVMFAPVAGTHDLYLTVKTEAAQPALKVRLLLDGVEVGNTLTSAQLNPLDTTTFNGTGGFAETAVPITFTAPTTGAHVLGVVIEQPSDTTYAQLIMTGLRLA